MHQSRLALDAEGTDPVDRDGFEIGWDHARHGLVPPPGLLLDGTPIGQGWRAGKAVFGQRTLPAAQPTRQWLELRVEAWRGGVAFEPGQLSAHVLAQLRIDTCPVLRWRLGGARSEPGAARFERLNPLAGYAAGNVVQISRGAALARAGVDIAEAVRRARRAQASGEPFAGLEAGAWWRLAVLRSFATPLGFAEAARLPLALLPPNRVRLLNAVQGLQALLTLQFSAPGWGGRLRGVACLLPEHTLRQDFNLWVGSLVPRVLQAAQRGAALRTVLEDSWLDELVLRRWQRFVFALGEAGVEALLARLAAAPLPGRVTLTHAPDQAVEGWTLARAGRLSAAAAPVGATPAAHRRTAPPSARPAPRATAGPRPSAR